MKIDTIFQNYLTKKEFVPKMESISRIMEISLPKKQSAFLWGPRKTGKTTYLNEKFGNNHFIDLLHTDDAIEFSKRPALLREQILALPPEIKQNPIIIDEVQKVPAILDEIHWLIENKGMQFILCGSSARKLKRGKANLLGGRAWRFEMFPLIWKEIGTFSLLTALNRGLIPSHYLTNHYKKSLRSYVTDYLKEEVFDEGLTRNIPAFSRFFDAMRFSHGELTNYSNIARDCGVDSKTVKEYYQILSDTLLGRMILPFNRRQSRQIITKSPKFYLFDVGVAGYLCRRKLEEELGEQFGKAFEHFILMEISAYNSYQEIDFDIQFWRTKTGLEVDFILGNGEVAIEVKGGKNIHKKDLLPLQRFYEEYKPRKVLLVCNEKKKRQNGNICIIPWEIFLKELWEDRVIR
jgi:predicted AAA+ superfamily ATPase